MDTNVWSIGKWRFVVAALLGGVSEIIAADAHQLAPIVLKQAVVRDVDLSGPDLTIDFKMDSAPEVPAGKSEYLIQLQSSGRTVALRRIRPATVALDLDAVQNVIKVQTTGSRNHIALTISGLKAVIFVNGVRKGQGALSAPLKPGMAKVAVGGSVDNKNVLTAPAQGVFLAEEVKSDKTIACWASQGHPRQSISRVAVKQAPPPDIDPCEAAGK